MVQCLSKRNVIQIEWEFCGINTWSYVRERSEHSIHITRKDFKCWGSLLTEKNIARKDFKCWGSLLSLIILEMFLQLDWSPAVVNYIDWTWFGKANTYLYKVPQLTVHVRAETEPWGRIVRRAPRQDCVDAQIWGRMPSFLTLVWCSCFCCSPNVRGSDGPTTLLGLQSNTAITIYIQILNT